jgi:hypothetical protein
MLPAVEKKHKIGGWFQIIGAQIEIRRSFQDVTFIDNI